MMKSIYRFSLVLCLMLAPLSLCPRAEPLALGTGVVTEARSEIDRYQPDPLAVRSMDPVFDMYPDSSLIDFSAQLDAPAGKDGFIQVDEDGHFYVSGTRERIRFWGVTVAASHIDIEKERIRQAVDVIARGGSNLLRLHEIDNRGGEKYNLVRRNIIDEDYPNNNRSTEFNEEYRDRVDYWIHCAKERGLYVYLVVRGYRTFRPEDGIEAADQLKRAAKPYAFFDPRLIELQKEYARQWLFEHVNPYTGMPNGLDPAVCMLEVENEDSLFFGHVPWRDFVEPYKSRFEKLWNEWLLKEYGSTEELRKAWTNDEGLCPLQENESLEQETVELPDMSIPSLNALASTPWDAPYKSPARTRDGVRFAMDVQKNYFSEMARFLRRQGSPIPLTAVVHSGVLPDTWTVAEELGAVGENAYQDHPSFMAGETWVGRSFFDNENKIRSVSVWGLAPHMARYSWAGAPLVCREWTTCWPNQYRASSALDIASLSLMQDYDMLVHFAYYTWGNPETINAFGPQSDPARWGLFGYAGRMFIEGHLEPEASKVAIAYQPEDLWTWASFYSSFHRLAWEFRTENIVVKDEEPSGEYLLTVTSGRSGKGKMTGNRLLLYDARYREWTEKTEDQKAEGLLWQSGYRDEWIYRGESFPVEPVKKAGFVPLPLDQEGAFCKAFYDPERENVVLASVSEMEAYQVARGFARWLAEGKLAPPEAIIAPIPEQYEVIQGDLVRDVENGILKINGSEICALAGELPVGQTLTVGPLEVQSISPIGAVAAMALDGKPLEESEVFSVKMVTVAENRGQRLIPVDEEGAPKPYVLDNNGLSPVQTQGKASEEPTRVFLGEEPVVDVFLENGTWEVVVNRKEGQCYVFCDTPNIRFLLNPEFFKGAGLNDVSIEKYFVEYPPEDSMQRGWDFIYPGFSKYVRLSAGGAGN
jgi:hypothetical protein